MPEIRILPENVVNQIAAGEVVERAASVLKELVENALDAQSTRIQIIAKGSGRDLIQVVDNGFGMTRNDLYLAFERHATSKLIRAEDLQSINTLGFRGEALPSIASVSYVEIRTCATDSESGTLLRFEAGTVVHEEPISGVGGTSIAVHSLFFNTPARARFLKSPATELSHLVRIFKQYALAYPRVAWTFLHAPGTEYNLPAGGLRDRLNDLYGAEFDAKTVELGYELDGYSVAGVIGKSELNRKTRGEQFIYLNRRPIQSPLAHSAVRAALKEQLEEGEWPFYVLLLGVPSGEVDVNVHPAKLEAKFVNESKLHAAIFRAIRTALPVEFGAERPVPVSAGISPSGADLQQTRLKPSALPLITSELPTRISDAPIESESSEIPVSAYQSVARHDHLFRPAIFQVHEKYLISQIQSGVAVIDQHAAHERILFEKAMHGFEARSFHSQQLLFPMLLELDPEDDAVFQEIRSDLEKLGFQIREFGPRAYSIEAIPAGLKRVSEAGMISGMIAEYKEFRRSDFRPREALAASFACHAAIRTGDSLTTEEMTALVDELFATEFPLTCPHGRPTIIHIKLSELDRRFKRTD